MSTPHVSVLMAVYNAEPYLNQALDSIFAQTFTDFELIVVNDASTDSSPAVLDSCRDPRLVVVTNPQNVGLTRCLNEGLKLAKGELIARHDADDISHADRFRQQVERLVAQPTLGVLGTSYQVVDGQGRILETVCPPTTNTEIQSLLAQGNLFCHGSVMLRRDYLEDVGAYREAFPVAQDYDLWLRLAEHCELASLTIPLYKFRFHGGSLTRNQRELQLACRRLAWEWAVQRRTGESEQPAPVDVLAAYPPEQWRLLRSARREVFLHYASGNFTEAAKSLQLAEQILSQPIAGEPDWDSWCLGKAQEVMRLSGDVGAGEAFVRWVMSNLSTNSSQRQVNRVLGRYYAAQAFLAHQNQEGGATLSHTLKATRFDLSWLRNRGLWSICRKSLLPGRRLAGMG